MRVFVICLIMLLYVSAVQAHEPIATVKSVSGQAEVLRNGSILVAQSGLDLLEADTLTTATNSTVGISFMDGTRISLGPASEMEITAYRFAPINKDYAFDIHFRKGTAVYSSGRMGKLAPETVHFRTPQAVLGIRGTTFLVRVE
jgi:hypothetical protein